MRKPVLVLAVIAAALSGLATGTSSPVGASTTGIWSPCASSEQGPPYVVIVKGVHGICVHYDAQVFQFDSVTGNKSMLIEITNDGYGVWDNLVWVNLASASLGSSIYENDIVYLVGRLDGTYSYTTSLGGTNTVPVIDVTQLRLAPSKPTATTTTTVKPKTTTTVKPKTPPTTRVPVRPTVKVIAQAHASGDQAEADAVGEATAFPIEAVVTSSPPQAADFNWNISCEEGDGGSGTLQGDKTVPLPVVFHIKAPSGSTDCFAEADVTLSGSGSLIVKLED